MNYQEYFDTTFKIKIFEFYEKNKNSQNKILGSLAAINALKSNTSIRQLSLFLENEIKDISKLFIDSLKETIKKYPSILEQSTEQIIDMFNRYIKVYIASNKNRLSDFLGSQSFSDATNHASKRAYEIRVNQIIDIYRNKIELLLNEQKDLLTKSEMESKMKKNSTKDIWKDIESEYGINKRTFGRKINFVTDKFKKSIIFRDVEQSFVLAMNGFSKPAVILAGSVIEELLRLYLEKHKIKPKRNDFNSYILACEESGILKSAVFRLTDSVRHFRNLVHLSNEKSSKYSISLATAKGAVSSIFTIANDF